MMDGYTVSYRGVNSHQGPHSSAGTEGIGLYVTKDKALAEWFGDIVEIHHLVPKKPIKADSLYLMQAEEEETLWEPENSSDSEWLKLNKLAVKAAGISSNSTESWDENLIRIEVELTSQLRAKGYDAVEVKSWYGSFNDEMQEWTVLLDPTLWA